MDSREVTVRGGTIRLGQLLKLADLVDSGSDAKSVLADGLVRVNGEVESRRGRQLSLGDIVELSGQSIRVQHARVHAGQDTPGQRSAERKTRRVSGGGRWRCG